jgi:hypothetical protein
MSCWRAFSRALVLCCFVLPAVVCVASNVVPGRALELENKSNGGTLPTNWGNMTALTYALSSMSFPRTRCSMARAAG